VLTGGSAPVPTLADACDAGARPRTGLSAPDPSEWATAGRRWPGDPDPVRSAGGAPTVASVFADPALDPPLTDPARIRSVRIRDLRSVWGPPLDLPLGERVTVLVGPNRAGTSNVAWSIAAALDPDRRYRPDRDRPRRHDGHPEVHVRLSNGHRGVVRWNPDTGERHVEGTLPQGHVILSRVQETPRDLLRRAPLDLADEEPRQRLGDAILAAAEAVLPEAVAVAVPDDLAVVIRDDLGSALPVPETRAMVALGLARHLAELGTPPVAVVVENPDAFLHPAGQEEVAELLLDVADRTGAPVVVTTASPFTIPREPETTVVALARDSAGRTGLVGTARGDATQARLLGGLLGDAGLAAVLDRVGRVPPDARGVIIVEGGTDEAYLRTVAATLGREEVLTDVVIEPSGGAMGAALAAIVLRAEVDVPLLVLLDHDDPGRRARSTLVSRFGFDRARQVVTYADVYEGHPAGVVAETLFDQDLVRRFVRERGRSASQGERTEHGLTHVMLTSAGKAAFVGWLERHVQPQHLERWAALLDLIEERLPHRAGPAPGGPRPTPPPGGPSRRAEGPGDV
jgi:5S rRNA maturation endonuclease (ribonuclease M5)